jgi:hypothetical protein
MSKPSDKQKASKTIQHKAADYDSVFSGVVEMLDAARRASARVVNTLMTATYWEIGRRIVEHEQAGEKRAEYGEELVRRLAADLTKQYGRGFGFSQLKMMRQFYQTFPDVHTAKPLILQSTVEKSEIGQSVIGQSGNLESSLVPIGQSLIGQFSQRSSVKLSRAIEHLGNIARAFPLPWTHYVRLLRGLRSAVGERGKWSGGGEERLANRSRSATPAAEPQTEARRSCGPAPCKLVTSARFAKWNGRRREGDRDDGQPVKRSKPRVGHGVKQSFRCVPSLMKIHPNGSIDTSPTIHNLITSITETSWIIEQRHSKGFCLYDFAHTLRR